MMIKEEHILVTEFKFKTTMLRSNLCDYTYAYILVNGRIIITRVGDNAAARQVDERDKGVTFKNCAPFIQCISRINNTEIDNAKDIDTVMSMYNLIEYNDNYLKHLEVFGNTIKMIRMMLCYIAWFYVIYHNLNHLNIK